MTGVQTCALPIFIDELSQYKNDKNEALYNSCVKHFEDKKNAVDMTNKIVVLDATTSSLYNTKEKYIEDLVNAGKEEDDQKNPVKIVRKANLLMAGQLTKENVDDYVNALKKQLLEELKDAETIQII